MANQNKMDRAVAATLRACKRLAVKSEINIEKVIRQISKDNQLDPVDLYIQVRELVPAMAW